MKLADLLIPEPLVGTQTSVSSWVRKFARRHVAGLHSAGVSVAPNLMMVSADQLSAVQWWHNDERRDQGAVFRPWEFLIWLPLEASVAKVRPFFSDASAFWLLDEWYGTLPWFGAACYFADAAPSHWRQVHPDPYEARRKIVLRVAQRMIESRDAIAALATKCRRCLGGTPPTPWFALPLLGCAEVATGTKAHHDWLMNAQSVEVMLDRFTEVADWEALWKSM